MKYTDLRDYKKKTECTWDEANAWYKKAKRISEREEVAKIRAEFDECCKKLGIPGLEEAGPSTLDLHED